MGRELDCLNEKRSRTHLTPTPRVFASKKRTPSGFLYKHRFRQSLRITVHGGEGDLEDELPAYLGWQAASLPSPAKLPDFRCGVERGRLLAI